MKNEYSIVNLNESTMKDRGESKVWKGIISKNGKFKKISNTQIGQQLLLDEALRVLPLMREWIDKDSGTHYRKELIAFFKDDDILLEKISSTFLYLAGSIYSEGDKRISRGRHKKIATLQKNIFQELSFELTWRFVEIVTHHSAYFGVERLMHYEKDRAHWSVKYICHLSETIISKLALEAAKAFYPLPMKEAPVDWSFEDGELKGGYSSYQYEMIRANNFDINYSNYNKRVFDSINYIQSIPWKVNKPILERLKQDLKAPVKTDYVKTEFYVDDNCKWEIDLKKDSEGMDPKELEKIKAAREVFRNINTLYKAECSDYESALGKYRAVKMAIEIAELYKDDIIYFPHSFDFRGRVYPLPVGLSPQGSDAVKALLVYAEVEEVNEVGEKWNWAYLASLYGEDKLAFDLRIKMGRELLYADYKDADEPYQFLSHQLELQKQVNDPTYIPNTRIHLDACNSGSQFTSAITGDKAGCIATNVIPTINEDGSHTRKDAYLLVANKSIELTKSMIDSEQDPERKEILEFFLELLLANGRKICKTPVMVSNYGGTAGGRAEIIWDLLRELKVDRKWITKKNASLFGRIVGDSITGVLNGGKAFETYIQKMNNLVAKGNKAVVWTTDDGFEVMHMKNKELKAKKVSCLIPGGRKKTTIIKKVYSKDVSPVKMKSAISPNYIHSLDAELLRRTALKMKLRGIKYSDWIHDSFGCHPNHVDLMLDITKDEFSKLVRRSPLRKLDKELRSQIDDTKKLQRLASLIKIPRLRGFDTANGDLDIVKESNWFFS